MKFTHWLLSMLSPASYKMVDNHGTVKELWIKQAFHDWENIETHIKREHPELKEMGK